GMSPVSPAGRVGRPAAQNPDRQLQGAGPQESHARSGGTDPVEPGSPGALMRPRPIQSSRPRQRATRPGSPPLAEQSRTRARIDMVLSMITAVASVLTWAQRLRLDHRCRKRHSISTASSEDGLAKKSDDPELQRSFGKTRERNRPLAFWGKKGS